jgi:hypothetical protein
MSATSGRPPSPASQRARELLGSHEEAAKTLVAQAQAAIEDGHLEGALRALLGLHAEVVPALDRLAAAELLTRGVDVAAGLSTVLGVLALWDELPDIDAEREAIAELIVRRAAAAESLPDGADPEGAPLGLALSDELVAAQAAWLREQLQARGVPRARWWWRMFRRARGGTGDCARVVVQRGALTVFEREPAGDEDAARSALPRAEPVDLTTPLGRFRAGDRLTLQFQVPLPGQIAVLHAAGDAHDAELSLLVPQHDGEAVARRHHEIVEVVGELSCTPGPAEGGEHSLVVLWAPEIVPPRWALDVIERRRVPPDARTWRYTYSVEPAQADGGPAA